VRLTIPANLLIKTVENSPPAVGRIYSIIFLHQFVSSFAYPVAKLGLNSFDPFVYAFFRFLFTSAIFSVILLFRRSNVSIPPRDHLKILLVGIVLIPANQLLFLVGQSLTTASHASLLFATTPIFIYLLAVLILKEKATFRRTFGIIIATAGVYLILTSGKIRFGREHLLGNLLIIAAVIAWAFGTIIGKPLAQKYGALRVTGLALTYGSLLYFPFGIYKTVQYPLSTVPWVGWFSVAYMAVVVSTFAYVLWYWILKYMEASRVAVIQNLQPIVASAAAVALLGEPITRHFVIGGVIILGGVLLTEIE